MSPLLENKLAELDAIKKAWEKEQGRFVTEMADTFKATRKDQLLSLEIEVRECIAKESSSQCLNSLEQQNEVRWPVSYCWGTPQANVTLRIDETQDLTVPEFLPSSLYRPGIAANPRSQVQTVPNSPYGEADSRTTTVPTGLSSGTVVSLPTWGNSPPAKVQRGRDGKVSSQNPASPHRRGPLKPKLTHWKFTEKPNIDFAEVESGNFWVFECKVRARGHWAWYYFTMRCPTDCECPVFSKNPMCEDRAAEHLRKCGQVFEDEYDMLRRYARIVISKHPVTRNEVKSHNSTLLATSEAELEKENLA
ncbi:hypothetical protein F4801DRAFT_583910 [Xylaria longipes]|nr:hypothetical protein F4801DRAFT_583910 [Xylaria longipes]